MRNREYCCNVLNLPAEILCAYRAHYQSEIKKHERSHTEALELNRKTNSRFYEVTIDEFQKIFGNSDANSDVVTINSPSDQISNENITAVQTQSGKVLFIEKQSVLTLMEKRLEARLEEIKTTETLAETPHLSSNLSDVSAPPSPDTQSEGRSLGMNKNKYENDSDARSEVTSSSDATNLPLQVNFNAIFPCQTPP